MWDPYAEFHSAILPNGLTVHTAYWPDRSWEALGFLIHSGAEDDPIGLEGLSHFVEHLVSENTTVSKKDLVDFFPDNGGTVNLGATTYHHTYYQCFVPVDRSVLARIFSLFGQMLLSAKLEKFIERERQVILGEYHRSFPTKVQQDLALRQRQALYTGCWLERFASPLGTSESVERITQSDLQSHYDRHYTPANMSIVGVGGMKLAELVELLSQSPFAANKKGSRTPLVVPVSDVSLPLESRYVFEFSKHITMAVPVEVGAYRSIVKIPGNVKTQSVRFLGDMLDRMLIEEVREQRAWSYAVGTSRRNFRCFHEFSIDCGVLALPALNTIERVVETCIASLGDRQDLFDQVKRQALAGIFMTDLTGQGLCGGALDDLATDQRIISLAEYEANIQQVQMSDIQDLRQWLRPERRWTIVTRP